MTSYYDTLVFSGGSMKGICILGALQYCYEKNLINGIKTLIGTSVGAVIAYLIIIGYTPIEFMTYLCTHPIYRDFPCMDILSMVAGNGAMSFMQISDLFEKLTIDKVGKLLTLGDIRNIFGKTLIITTYNYTKKKMEYLSADIYPDMPCIVALRMSCSMPLLFNMYKYMDCYYTDGAICDNFPILYNIENDIDVDSVRSHRLGFVLDMGIEDSTDKKETTNNFDFLQHIYSLLIIPSIQDMKNKLEKGKHIDIIKLHTDVNPLDFQMSPTTKMETFSSGYRQAKKFFND